jgi:hypothetical protein
MNRVIEFGVSISAEFLFPVFTVILYESLSAISIKVEKQTAEISGSYGNRLAFFILFARFRLI